MNSQTQILLVEDDEINLELLTAFLEESYAVTKVRTGEEALREAFTKSYEIILMDIHLGKGISGLDAIKEIRKLEKYRSVPIIAITAFNTFGDQDTFLNAGCSHYLPKPFTKNDLISLLETIH